MTGRTWYITTDSSECVISTEDDAMKHLMSVKGGSSEFMVLEPEPGSETDFFQTSAWTDGVVLGRSYIAEIRTPSADGFRQSRLRTKDFDEILRAAECYIHSETPCDGKWVDVTDEFLD